MDGVYYTDSGNELLACLGGPSTPSLYNQLFSKHGSHERTVKELVEMLGSPWQIPQCWDDPFKVYMSQYHREINGILRKCPLPNYSPKSNYFFPFLNRQCASFLPCVYKLDKLIYKTYASEGHVLDEQYMYRGTPHNVLDKQNVLRDSSALDLLEGPVPGIHLDEPAFLSCTPDIAHAARFVHGSPCCILRFQIPSNVRYHYDKHTKNTRGDECIIQRNTTLKNFKFNPKKWYARDGGSTRIAIVDCELYSNAEAPPKFFRYL
ncbi:hypothetical protein SARC_00067 [Sphaeroforma arctica JP610]|uniref:Uncharacterized protein n=1 Tax=Sphaeroforma arctica JP610 TaxID=667725 RepID=A0A0L0GFF8_9EUKA|nr:hypothetical protein SARC_00067 [Sphaeroforma arctica JP610]KNC87810.1 hypothetical protein SARC_00067 [Sphaeroforma arctica JP610]|eukprot:XP_014161712.1 hypothetical protein SARC_00067 [Sphaeroforma arctica JP610]